MYETLEHQSSNIWRRSPTPPPSGGRLGGGHSADGLTRQFPHAPGLPPSSPPPAGGRLPAKAMGQGEYLTDVLGTCMIGACQLDSPAMHARLSIGLHIS